MFAENAYFHIFLYFYDYGAMIIWMVWSLYNRDFLMTSKLINFGHHA